MNISAPFIHRPVGTALLTVVVVLRVAEFLAEKWGQKNRKKIDFSAPIFLPFPPALLLQGHELNSVPSQVDPMEGAQWTVAKKRMKLLLIVLGACGEGRQPKCRVLVDKMGTLVPQRQAVAPQLHHPRHLLLAAKEVGQRFHVKAKFEKAAPILQQIQKSGAKELAALVSLAPSMRVHRKLSSRLSRQRGVDKSRLNLRWPKIDQFAVMRPMEAQVVEQLGVMVRHKPCFRFEFIDGRIGNDQVKAVGLGKIPMRNDYRHLFAHRVEAGSLQTGGKVVPIDNLITKSPQFVLRIEGVTHDSVINLSELFLPNRAHTDKGCNGHKFMAETWWQKDKKKIHISAPIFLPRRLHSL